MTTPAEADPPGRLRSLSRRGAVAVLFAAAAWVALLQWVAATHDTTPESRRRIPPGEEGPDVKYYRTVVARVAAGEPYYPVLAQELPAFGFPTASVFNWRPPTYAWFLGPLGGEGTRLLAGCALVAAAILVSMRAVHTQVGFWAAVAFAVLELCIAGYLLVPEGRYFTEMWAAVLLLLSVGLLGCGFGRGAVLAGVAALFMRELAAVYVVVAALEALRRRRWGEARAWAAGVGAFWAFFAWHVYQVFSHRPADAVAGPGWLAFGGLTLDLAGARMNVLLAEAPGWAVALYVGLAAVGFLSARPGMQRVAALSAYSYLALFAFVGRSMNHYWGVLTAVFLGFGIVLLPRTIRELAAAIRRPAAPQPAA